MDTRLKAPREFAVAKNGMARNPVLCFICRNCATAVSVSTYEVIDVWNELQDARATVPCAICPSCNSLVDVTGLTEHLQETEGTITRLGRE